MTRFWWVRHGPTHRKDMIGWTDVAADLSDVDRLSRLAAYLPAKAPVICSDLLRCRATADALIGGRVNSWCLSRCRRTGTQYNRKHYEHGQEQGKAFHCFSF